MSIRLGFLYIKSWELGDPLVDYDPNYTDISPDEIILSPNTEYHLIFGYPFIHNIGYRLSVKSKGLTRKTFIRFVVRKYRQIYADPEKVNSIMEGHILDDLILHTLNINGNVLSLGIDNSRGLMIC